MKPFYKTPPGNCFCSTEKYSSNKIVKNTLRKETNWKHLVRKTMTHTKQKLNLHLHSSLHILLIFKNFFIPLFSASHDILKTRVFRKQGKSIEDLSTIENYVSPSA